MVQGNDVVNVVHFFVRAVSLCYRFGQVLVCFGDDGICRISLTCPLCSFTDTDNEG